MNEEEKQVIIRLQSNRDKLKENFSYTKLSKKWLSEDIDEAINLIDRQQKEITRLQNIKRKDIQDLINAENENIYKNYIHKNKIKEKIKELESHIWKDGYMTKFDRYAIHYLKELLGE